MIKVFKYLNNPSDIGILHSIWCFCSHKPIGRLAEANWTTVLILNLAKFTKIWCIIELPSKLRLLNWFSDYCEFDLSSWRFATGLISFSQPNCLYSVGFTKLSLDFGLWNFYYVKCYSQFLQMEKRKYSPVLIFFPKKFSFKHNQHFINQNSTTLKIWRTEVLLYSICCSIFSGFYWQLCPLSDNRKSAMSKQVEGIWLWLCLLWMWSRLIELQPLHTTGR